MVIWEEIPYQGLGLLGKTRYDPTVLERSAGSDIGGHHQPVFPGDAGLRERFLFF